ncbi:MAG TPA: DNA polymerase III subunit gamma/tau [Aquihabitans sp.]|jgi:DNA polymerase-3 subunit gamma/tau|nr:DNA polymerase III subunit gamma/tau [Aquihabitans sp.]
MAYQSLYRRYRPRRFSDVRGQEHVVRALRGAVRDERVGHAYLFSGPRGTGKTSTARILAKALNCEHLVDGEPDGTCESCLAIDAGTSYDVQELDAASNNGVGDVRDLIGRVNLGSPGRTKVYILDEVHMLSSAASAALLKTLEEPPAHVVFVLATTDPQKVLPTIRSRTQHFDFHLLSVEELSEHVRWVIQDAALGLPDDVVDHVVRAGAGSARDTLSSLDQVAAAGGVVDEGQPLDDLLDAVAASDSGKALVAVAEAISAGRDARILGEAVLARLRDIFLLRMGGGTAHLPPGDLARVQAWADQLGDRATTRALEAVGDALLEMRQAPDPRIPLEVALVKITRVDADVSIDGLLARIAKLEDAVAAGAAAPHATPAAPTGEASTPPPSAPAIDRTPRTEAPTAVDRSTSPPAGRPAPPPRPGARPADGARAQLAANRAERPAPPARPAPGESTTSAAAEAPAAPPASPTPAATPTPSPGARPVPPDPAPGPATGPIAGTPAASSPPAPSERRPTAPTPPAKGDPDPGPAPGAETPAAGALPTPEQLIAIWNESVLPSLGGLAKAMYAVGRFTATEGSTAVLAFPNEVHRQKCEQKRGEVEQALSERLGSPVTLRLVVDSAGDRGDDPGDAQAGPRGGGRRAPGPPPEDDFDLGGQDVHDLDDAPDAPTGGLDALTQAFPGSELVEGS